MDRLKKVSVCMATFNGEQYISEQIRSILPQLTLSDEVIISDDNSMDRTLQILESFKDPRIKIYLNSKDKGYTNNFENALEHVNGDIIFLSDQDDLWHPKKVEKMLFELTNCDFVISDAEIVDMNLTKIHKSYFRLRNSKPGFFNNLLRCRYLGSCYAFKRKILEKALPFPSDSQKLPHDYWLVLLGSAYFNTRVIKDSLIKYRRHSSNVSNGGEKSTNSFFKKIHIRLYALINIILISNK